MAAAAPAAPSYAVRATATHGQGLFATRPIAKGEEIISEEPLGVIGGILHHIFDDDQFYDPNQARNGVQAITTMVDKMTAQQAQQFRNLANSHPPDAHGVPPAEVGIMQTNNFTDQRIDEHGQRLVTLVIFNDISRANNSCRPNALFSYDFTNGPRGRGSLHALCKIDTGAEILVEYLASEDHSLQTAAARQDDLENAFGFRCDCEACDDDAEDDDQRQEAAAALEAVDGHEPPTNRGEEKVQIREATEYIDLLHALNIYDYKLAHAYECRAKIHRQSYDRAFRTGRKHCKTCLNQHTPWSHLYAAYLDISMVVTIHTTCYGLNLPKSQEALIMQVEIWGRLPSTKMPTPHQQT
jgi:hypothetical protein